jgi:tyrosyl-tRNA synthetase
MSKSLNNYIALEDPYDEMFGKIMSISDQLMWRYFDLLSFKSDKEIRSLKLDEKNGENPRNIKFILAEEIVDRFHGEGSGLKAREEFINRFQKGNLPEEVETISINIQGSDLNLPRVLKDSGMVQSTSEAMRLIKQGAVKIQGKKVLENDFSMSKGTAYLVQVGKRKLANILLS